MNLTTNSFTCTGETIGPNKTQQNQVLKIFTIFKIISVEKLHLNLTIIHLRRSLVTPDPRQFPSQAAHLYSGRNKNNFKSSAFLMLFYDLFPTEISLLIKMMQ